MSFWREPKEVAEIREKVRDLEIQPVDSEASRHFQKHGKRFEKEAIRALIHASQNHFSL